MSEDASDRGKAKAYWFGPKTIGIGSGPKTWQGWLLTLVFALAVIATARLSFWFIHDRTIAGGVTLAGLACWLAIFLWVAGRHTDPDSAF